MGIVQPVHRASLRGALIFVILVPKSYMDRAHKPQISPRHGLDLVWDHVMGFLQPTLGPLGYLVVKRRSKCGQLWTLGIEECLRSWGSSRLKGDLKRSSEGFEGVDTWFWKRKERRKRVE